MESQRENRSRSFDSSPITLEKEKSSKRTHSHHERKRAGSLTSTGSNVTSDIQNNNSLMLSDNPILLKSTSAPSTPKRNTSHSISTSSSSSNFQNSNLDNSHVPLTDVLQIKDPNTTSDFYVRTDELNVHHQESLVPSPNISSKSVSNDQESGKSMDSSVQDPTVYQSAHITDGVGIRSMLPPSRSPVTRSPSPPAAINRSTKSHSFPMRPGGVSSEHLGGFASSHSHSYSHSHSHSQSQSPFLSPSKQKIPRSPRRFFHDLPIPSVFLTDIFNKTLSLHYYIDDSLFSLQI